MVKELVSKKDIRFIFIFLIFFTPIFISFYDNIHSQIVYSETGEIDNDLRLDGYNSTYNIDKSLNTANDFHNINFTNPSYLTTYDFSNDRIGSNPNRWYVSESGNTSIQVIPDLDNHSNVVELYDNDDRINCNISNIFSESVVSGSISLLFRATMNDLTDNHFIYIYNGIIENGLKIKHHINGWYSYEYNIYGKICDFNANQWYYIEISFDCIEGYYDVIIKKDNKTGIILGYNDMIKIKGNPIAMDHITIIASNNDVDNFAYIDDIYYSWDSKYWQITDRKMPHYIKELTDTEYGSSNLNNNIFNSQFGYGIKSSGMWEAYTFRVRDSDTYDDMKTAIRKGSDEIDFYGNIGSKHGYIDDRKMAKFRFNLTTQNLTLLWTNETLPSGKGGVINDTIFLFVDHMNGSRGYIYSLDGLEGEKWSDFVSIMNIYPNIFSYYDNLKSSNVSGTYYRVLHCFNETDNIYTTNLLKTTDYGKTWEKGPILYNGSHNWYETTITHIGNGRFIGLIREEYGGNYVAQTTSSDNGETWSKITYTNLGDGSGVKPSYIEYDKETDKVIVMYRDRSIAGHPLYRSYQKYSISDAQTVFNNASAWEDPKICFWGDRLGGYPQLIKISHNEYLYYFNEDADWHISRDSDLYAGYIRWYNDVYYSINNNLNYSFEVLDLDKQDNYIIPFNLTYSYKTNINQLIDFSVWNFDSNSWELINSSTNNVSFNENTFPLNSSHINSTNDILLNFYGLNTPNDFELYLENLSVNYKWIKISEDQYSTIEKNIKGDVYDDCNKKYDMTIRFNYKFINNTKYSYFADILINNNIFPLSVDGIYHSFNYSFHFDPTIEIGYNLKFNITNGKLYLKNIGYSIYPVCQMTINNGDIYTNDTLVFLTLFSTYATEVCFKNNTGSWSIWESYETSKHLYLNGSVNNTEYTIFVKFRNDLGKSDIVSDDIIYKNIFLPLNPSISINNGDIYTNNTLVNLTLYSTYANEMCFKIGNGSWSDWEIYNTSKQINISGSENNTKYTISVKFKNVFGESDMVSDSIIYLVNDNFVNNGLVLILTLSIIICLFSIILFIRYFIKYNKRIIKR